MARQKTHDFTPDQVRDMYLGLGRQRSLKKLFNFIRETYRNGPALCIIKRWSHEGGWPALAEAHDQESQECVAAKSGQVFHAKERLLNTASLLMDRLDEWAASSENAKVSVHIKGAADARATMASVIDAIKMAEVLEGRVSDRKAAEVNVDVEDKRRQASERALEKREKLRRLYESRGMLNAPGAETIIVDAAYEPARLS